MPFKSYAQQKLMFAKHPKIAKRWAKKYGTLKKPCPGSKIKSNGKGRGLGKGKGKGPMNKGQKGGVLR